MVDGAGLMCLHEVPWEQQSHPGPPRAFLRKLELLQWGECYRGAWE